MLYFTSGLNTFLATFSLIATLKIHVVRALRSVNFVGKETRSESTGKRKKWKFWLTIAWLQLFLRLNLSQVLKTGKEQHFYKK